MPARRVFLALGVTTLLLAVAAIAPVLAATALALDGAILLAFLVDRARAARITLAAERAWPTLLAQGSPTTVEVRMSAGRRVVVELREALHPGLAPSPLRARLEVRDSGAALWTYPLVPRLRGDHRAGPLTARVLGPWGFAWSQRELLAAQVRRVYPQVRWEGKVGRLLALAHRKELGQTPLRAQGLGVEPYALREYRPGDPLSKIHWKATARHGRLVTREDAWERGSRLVVLLDCARGMTTRAHDRSKLDHALASALALARIAVSRGDRVSVVAFSDRVERVVRLGSGVRALSEAYAALFDLDARATEPAYDLVAEAVSLVEGRRARVVLLTSIVDLSAAEMLRESLLGLSRHRVLLVNLEDPELTALAASSPNTAAEAFAKVSGLEIVLANRRLGQRLRRAGVHVVAAAAGELAWATLDAYLGLARTRAAAAGR